MVYLCEFISSTLLPGLYNCGLPRQAGNSLLPSTMNGMSSGGIAPTDGQYGSVPFFQVSSNLIGTAHPQQRIDPFLL